MKIFSWILIFLILVTGIVSVINNRESNPNFLDDELLQIENYFEQRDISNTKVSQVNVAWHLDHMLKTINNITEDAALSNPKNYKSKFNIRRIVVHTTGVIPRGVAQSPESVRPPEIILLDSLKLQLKRVRKSLDKIDTLDEYAFFEHPVFDQLDRDQTRRFLDIHTNHHLKIIADILGK